ncbi:MAG: low molecular weight protein arginine phosphatase [Elusimicrobiota bacterium]|nr:low molecular weight protein arginine phosphatase [Elusimicrobiota bacterium]
MKRVAFVCTGNICRSAMAEHLLRHWSAQRGLGLELSSCGVAAEPWYEMPSVARRLLLAEGVPPFEHKARLATRETLRGADLVLAMTRAHQDFLVDRFPEFGAKTRLFLEQAGLGERDVDDPMGRPDAEFVRCLATLKEGLEALIRRGWRD